MPDRLFRALAKGDTSSGKKKRLDAYAFSPRKKGRVIKSKLQGK